MSDDFEKEYERLKNTDWVEEFEKVRHLPVTEEELVELYAPRDWERLLVRFVKSPPGEEPIIEAWHKDDKCWGRFDTNWVKVLRSPLATHREMDLQGVPMADRTRFNPKK